MPSLNARFEGAWKKLQELMDELEKSRAKKYLELYEEEWLEKRTKAVAAASELLLQKSEPGLILFEEWFSAGGIGWQQYREAIHNKEIVRHLGLEYIGC